MAVSELSLDEVHKYILANGGRVPNRELVKHFKKYLTHPESKNDARIKFKEYVNSLATSKTEGDEKFIILRSKYTSGRMSSPVHLPQNTLGIPSPVASESTPTKSRQPPPYRPPPPVDSPSPSLDNISICSSSVSIKESEDVPPQAPPRRKSQSRLSSVEVEPVDEQQVEGSSEVISVRERTQKFNRLASVENELSPQPKEKQRRQEMGADEDDGASVTSLEPKRTEWIVAAARGDYQALAKLATANPRLVKTKDPFTAYTALHWAAKHGNSDIVKLIAGKYRADANARTNGGYTPLHIAMQYGHVDVFKLFVDVYGGVSDIRDWSGRKPISYLKSEKNTTKSETYRSEYIPKPAHKPTGKSQSFIRRPTKIIMQRRAKSDVSFISPGFSTNKP